MKITDNNPTGWTTRDAIVARGRQIEWLNLVVVVQSQAASRVVNISHQDQAAIMSRCVHLVYSTAYDDYLPRNSSFTSGIRVVPGRKNSGDA